MTCVSVVGVIEIGVGGVVVGGGGDGDGDDNDDGDDGVVDITR